MALLALLPFLPMLAAASPETHGRVRPLRQIYRTHQGWEYRTEHFITVATTSGDDARWAGEELESSWQETARLADHFGDMHRRQNFGLVGGLVTGSSTAPRTTGTRYPKLTLPASRTLVQAQLTAGDQSSRIAARKTLRRGGAAALLRQSGYDERLPAWAATGLTEFVADGPWDKERFDREQRAAESNPGALPAWGVVFRHLMTHEDGTQAASHLASLADYGDFSASRLQRRVPIHTRWDKVTAGHAEIKVHDSRTPQLPNVSQHQLRERIQNWLVDPNGAGTVIDMNIAADDPAAARASELALLVLLWRHYGVDGEEKADRPAAPVDVDHLYRKLTSPTGPAWSAVDTDGRLLTWRDQQRIDMLFMRGTGRFQSVSSDGRSVLQFRDADGTTLEAWFDRTADGKKPTIHVRRAPGSVQPR